MRILEENEKSLTPEEIEKQKKIVDDLYKKEREERENYLKSFEEDRKASFEESKTMISPLISEKSFIREKQRERDLERMEIKPEIEKTGEAIEKSVGEKAFMIEKHKEEEQMRKEIKPDIRGVGEAISKTIDDKAFLIEKRNPDSISFIGELK